MHTLTHAERPWRRPLRQVNREPAPWVYHAIVRIARMFIPLVSRRAWAGQEHIPGKGGVIIVSNHTSNFDAVALGEYLIWSGRWPRFLGKSDIWRVPVLGWVARRCRQILVLRGTERAADSLIHAAAALEEGAAVAIFPEGTITRDPEGWPMTGRRGAARLALRTGAPVIPVVHLGCERVLGGYHIQWWRLFGRPKPVTVCAMPPVDLTGFRGDEPTEETLDEATRAIMEALTQGYARLRDETPPRGRFDLRIGRRA